MHRSAARTDERDGPSPTTGLAVLAWQGAWAHFDYIVPAKAGGQRVHLDMYRQTVPPGRAALPRSPDLFARTIWW